MIKKGQSNPLHSDEFPMSVDRISMELPILYSSCDRQKFLNSDA